MSSFVKGLIVGVSLVVVFIAAVGLVAFLAASGESKMPSDAVLVLQLKGEIPEHIETEMPPFLPGMNEGGSVTLLGMTQAVRRAAEDESVKALVLRCDGSSAGWAKAQELRWSIQEFRESGKPVWAFLEIAGREDYYIASLADRIVIQPESFLELSGLRMEVMFFKSALDKLGVKADLIRTGKYKSAGEPYSREEMSPEWRQVLNETLDEFYRQLLEGLAEGRGHEVEHWRALLDEGPFDTAEAHRHGLVDDVLDGDGFYEKLSDALGVEEVHPIDAGFYARRAAGAGGGEKIALMHATGTIVSGSSSSDPFSGMPTVLGSHTFNSHLEDLRDDKSISGVILRIDSPGGDAIASEQMLRAVRRLSEEKPVVVSMSNVAASGGYYIASAPEVPIVAYPGTYTGSIGVFTIHINLRDLYDKLGISKEILTRGRFAGMYSDYKALTADERAKVRKYVDSIYETFLTRVSEGRDVDTDSVRELAEGRVWVGAQASENGLIDELGGYGAAVDLVKQAAEIDEDAPVRLISYPPRRGLLDTLFSRGRREALIRLLDSPGFSEARRNLTEVMGWTDRLRNGAMFMAPFTLTVE